MPGMPVARAGARDLGRRCSRSPIRCASPSAIYLGPKRAHDYPHHPHEPPVGMWGPVAAARGWRSCDRRSLPRPGGASRDASPRTRSSGGDRLAAFAPALWHGFTPALGMSLFAVRRRPRWLYSSGGLARRGCARALPRPDAKSAVRRTGSRALSRLARRLNARLHNGELCRRYLAVICRRGSRSSASSASSPHAMRREARPTLPLSVPAIVVWLLIAIGCLPRAGSRVIATGCSR